MRSLSILILGVTGDLAKRKIIPAVSQFVSLHTSDTLVNFHGYSRSAPDIQNINDLLQSYFGSQGSFGSIQYKQGEYDDPHILDSYLASLKPQEQLIVYLAVPPKTIVGFLNTLSIPPEKLVNIVIEKPFGQSIDEAKQIIELIKNRSLSEQVVFIDHYLFKTETRISKVDLSNFKQIKSVLPLTLSVSALEELGVGQRLGYYITSGAIKDMSPHIFSLLKLYLKLFHDVEFDGNITTHSLGTGQYQSFQEEVSQIGHVPVETETYFRMRGLATLQGSIQGENYLKHDVEIALESGKMLGKKETLIQATFSDGSVLTWNIAPHKTLSLTNPMYSTVEINLNTSDKLDHTNMFEDLLNLDYSRFVTFDEVIEGWNFCNEIVSHVNTGVHPIQYKDGIWPLEKVDEMLDDPEL